MRKIITIILAMVMLFAITVFIVGCGNGETVVVETPTPTPTPTAELEIVEPEDEGGLQLAPPPTPQATPPPTPEPTPTPITSVAITERGATFQEEFSGMPVYRSVGDILPLQVRVEPPGAYKYYDILWETGDDSIVKIEMARLVEGGQLGQGAIIELLAVGETTIRVMVGDEYDEVIVRVR